MIFGERKLFTTLGWVKRWQTKNKSLLQSTLYDSDEEIVDVGMFFFLSDGPKHKEEVALVAANPIGPRL